MSPFTTELAAARKSQESWSRVSVRERLKYIRNLRALLVDRTDDICAAVHADIARPSVEVIATELLPATSALKFLEKRAEKLLAPRRISWWDQPTWLFGCRDAVHHRPWGVVGIIGTWNYPLFLNVGQIAQAFVAGNAVLWKPSENVPRTAELTQSLFREAGFPPELLQLLPATRDAGPQLAETDVDHVVFTGSDVVGRKLAAKLGERLIPSTMELSGCDAMFVLPDANIEMAAKAAWFGLSLNRGQTCIAVRRIFVQWEAYRQFREQLGLLAAGVNHVPLVLKGQVEQAKRLVQDATAKGAEPINCPRSPESENLGPVFPPTILSSPTADLALFCEAAFAPIAAIVPFNLVDDAAFNSPWPYPWPRFRTIEEAITSLAKQSPFGLSASIFSADTAKAQELAAQIPSGSVVINDVLAPTAHPATPFGGRGSSGWGVTQGAEGLLAMTVPQVVTVHAGSMRPHFDEAAKPDEATGEILRGLMKWTHSRGFGAKLRGLLQMVRGVRKKK